MASKSGGMGEIVKYAALAGIGYYVYTRYFVPTTAAVATTPAATGSTAVASTPAAGYSLTDLINAIKGAVTSPASTPPAGTVTPVTTTPPVTTNPAPPVVTVPAAGVDLAAQLMAAAQGNIYLVDGKMSAYDWNYYRNQLYPPDLTGSQFGTAYPNLAALPATDPTVPITAQQFVASLKSVGLAGLGAVRIATPRVVVLGRGARR